VQFSYHLVKRQQLGKQKGCATEIYHPVLVQCSACNVKQVTNSAKFAFGPQKVDCPRG
jgi:hypothetical protein